MVVFLREGASEMSQVTGNTFPHSTQECQTVTMFPLHPYLCSLWKLNNTSGNTPRVSRGHIVS